MGHIHGRVQANAEHRSFGQQSDILDKALLELKAILA